MAKTKVRVLVPGSVAHLGAAAGDVVEVEKSEADAMVAIGVVEQTTDAVGTFDKTPPGAAVFPEPARGETKTAPTANSTEAVGHSEKDFEPLPVAKPSEVIEPEADPDAAVTNPVDEPKPTPKAVDEVAKAKRKTTRKTTRKKK
jgi:hypothetical protein